MGFCINCGNNMGGDRFCSECGTKSMDGSSSSRPVNVPRSSSPPPRSGGYSRSPGYGGGGGGGYSGGYNGTNTVDIGKLSRGGGGYGGGYRSKSPPSSSSSSSSSNNYSSTPSWTNRNLKPTSSSPSFTPSSSSSSSGWKPRRSASAKPRPAPGQQRPRPRQPPRNPPPKNKKVQRQQRKTRTTGGNKQKNKHKGGETKSSISGLHIRQKVKDKANEVKEGWSHAPGLSSSSSSSHHNNNNNNNNNNNYRNKSSKNNKSASDLGDKAVNGGQTVVGGLYKVGKGITSKIPKMEDENEERRKKEAAKKKKKYKEIAVKKTPSTHSTPKRSGGGGGARAAGGGGRSAGRAGRETIYIKEQRAKINRNRGNNHTYGNSASSSSSIPRPMSLASGLTITLSCTGSKEEDVGARKPILKYEVKVQWSNMCWIIYRRFRQFNDLYMRIREADKTCARAIKGPGKHATMHDADAISARTKDVSMFCKSIEHNQRELLHHSKVKILMQRFFAPVQFGDLKAPGAKLPFDIKM